MEIKRKTGTLFFIVCIHCWLLSPIFKSIHKLYQYLVAKCFFGLSLDIEIKILYNSLYNA